MSGPKYRGVEDIDKTVKMMRALKRPFDDGKHIVTMRAKSKEDVELFVCFLNCETGKAKFLSEFGISDRGVWIGDFIEEGSTKEEFKEQYDEFIQTMLNLSVNLSAEVFGIDDIEFKNRLELGGFSDDE